MLGHAPVRSIVLSLSRRFQPEYRRNVPTGRVKLTEQVYDPTCLLTLIVVYIAYIAWLLHTHATHILDTFGHLLINSFYKHT